MGEEIAYLNANLAHEELPVPEKSCLGQRLGEGVRDHRHSVHVRNGDDALLLLLAHVVVGECDVLGSIVERCTGGL